MTKLGFSLVPRRGLLAISTLLFLLMGGEAGVDAQERGPLTRIGQGARKIKPDRAGRLAPKPDGSGFFFVDPHQLGLGAELRITGLAWGRLVDVHGLVATGDVDPRPVFRDLVVHEGIQTDGVDYVLERNPVTQVERLIVLREPGAAEPAAGLGTFIQLVRFAAGSLAPVVPKTDDGTGAQPFSLVKRNAALVARFDDLLDDSDTAAANLVETVRLLTGYPPTTPYQPRIFFDPNYGGTAGGEFHSSRVVIDLTISEVEAGGMAVPAPLNALGLPPSVFPPREPNVSLRLPSQIDPGSQQFSVLTSLGGASLSTTTNGPVDLTSPTLDVVRAMRSGNDRDPDEGFLADENAPELLGGMPMVVTDITDIPGGELGFDFLLILNFPGACRLQPRAGDVLQVGQHFAELLVDGPPPDVNGTSANLIVRNLGTEPIDDDELLGAGLFLAAYRAGEPLDDACWFSFVPQAATPPGTGVPTSVQFLARFSEPMDPDSLKPFDTFRVEAGDSGAPPLWAQVVVGEVRPSPDLSEFAHTPLLPLDHTQGIATPYHLELADATDLAGNPLAANPGAVDFTVDPAEPDQATGGIVLTFASADELEPMGAMDLRGQFLYDFERELLRPRPLVRSSHVADQTVPIGGIKIPYPFGTQVPLTPLGAKVQSVWRYADFGFQVQDETKYNLDIEGMAWAPNGSVVSDFFEEFEMRLAHSSRLPDEDINANLLPRWPASGLLGAAGQLFSDNVLVDPASPQAIVHPRALGYEVSPVDQFTAPTGTVMMPYPLNRGAGPDTTYTWRDTAITARAGADGAGVPMDIEVGPPLFLEPGPPGSVAPSGFVPSFGLPLLVEIRAYPSDTAIGLNLFDVSLAINSSINPTFRAYSAGGVDTTGSVVVKNPDLEAVPSGGFNPASVPPGQPTRPTDNLTYFGQIDTITRISRVHSVWIDTGSNAPDFFAPLVEADTPGASDIVIEFRGATGFSADAGGAPFDATRLDPYGDLLPGQVDFLDGQPAWAGDIDDVDGARYLQLRFSFVGDADTRSIALLEALGIAFGG